MYIRNYFEVLLVDDEPDVLAVSKLALKNLKLYGVPLRIHTATSKAQAIEVVNATSERGEISVGLLDVVMENDRAGLELAQHIRENLKNRVMQLLVRTGQAGKAPEREVIDRYFGILLEEGRREGLVRKDVPVRVIIQILLGAVDAIMNPPRLAELGLTPKAGFTAILSVILEGVITPEGRSRR